MSAIKFEAARIHFLSDVFVAVAVVFGLSSVSDERDAYGKGGSFTVTVMMWLVHVVQKGKLKIIKSCKPKK